MIQNESFKSYLKPFAPVVRLVIFYFIFSFLSFCYILENLPNIIRHFQISLEAFQILIFRYWFFLLAIVRLFIVINFQFLFDIVKKLIEPVIIYSKILLEDLLYCQILFIHLIHCWILLDMVEYSQIIFDIVRYCKILISIIRYCQILFNIIRYCKILLDIGTYCHILQDITIYFKFTCKKIVSFGSCSASRNFFQSVQYFLSI